MQRIGQDEAEKLDYKPGVFTVERHVRGKWACRCCQKLVQAPVPAHVIDKGIPAAGLLAHLLVVKFMDHPPLYRKEHIFERAGHLIARSTLAQWVGECGAQLNPLVQALADELRRHVVLHADETPAAMLKPKQLRDGRTHKAYIWSQCTTSANPTKVVVFEFSDNRAGENVREFLKLDTPQAWQGTLVTDGFSGYNATTTKGVTSAQCRCLACAWRHFWRRQLPALTCCSGLRQMEQLQVRGGPGSQQSYRASCTSRPIGEPGRPMALARCAAR